MLFIKDLNLFLQRDLRPLVKDFTFSPGPRQQKIALIGEEGNGKSTLLKAIYDPALIEPYVQMTGEIHAADEIIGYLPQQIGGDWHDRSASDLLLERYPWDQLDFTLCFDLLKALQMEPEQIAENRRAIDLSGGEKIKFVLLMELLKRPTLLLLDEPTNDLDLDAIAWLERFILDAEIPILFVSHDERLLERCSDTIIHFEQLIHKTRPVHTIASLNYRDYMSNRAASIEKQTRMAAKEQEEYQKKMARYQQIFERVQHEQRVVSRGDPLAGRNLKDKMHSVKSMGRRFERERDNMTKKPVTEDAINIRFDDDIHIPSRHEVLDLEIPILMVGDRVLSRGISLSIRGAEKICIVGPNGSGKTTLLREVMRKLEDAKINCGYMPQMYDEALDVHRTPVDFLTRDGTGEEHTRIRTYLGSLNFTPEEMLRPIQSLSGGQKAKLYFAKMIFDRNQFLILDEPTRNLSPLSGPEIRQALLDFTGGILAVSHDRAFIEDVFDEVYLLTPHGLRWVAPEDYTE